MAYTCYPSTQEAEARGLTVHGQCVCSCTHTSFVWEYNSVVKRLPSMCKDLGSIPSTTHTRKT
jgi:hypothetical protein